MADNTRITNNPAPFTKVKKALHSNPGPYIGIIKNNIDPTRAGRLQVYIPQLGGSDANDQNGWLTVAYASPFRGQTKRRAGAIGYVDTATDPTASVNSVDENSFQSYGFWFVPPDLNTQILCIFLDGDPAQGYWFACVADSFDSHMVPGIGSAPAAVVGSTGSGGYIWSPTTYATHANLQQYIQLSDPATGATEIPARLPVAEAVLNAQLNATNVNNVQIVPAVAQTRILGIQGLAFDFVRGTTTASSTRENPSQVFGVSTPGRLSSFANLASSQNLMTLMQTYVSNKASLSSADLSTVEAALGSSYRAGGHQLVLDDGTVNGQDQAIRIRTAGGNMLLMDDTNGQVYIINASGNAWIEMTPSGRIDVFSANDYSVRSQGNINFHSDQNISMNAEGTFQVRSSGNMNLESDASLNVRAASAFTLYSAATLSLGSGGKLVMSASGDASLQSGGTLNLNGTTTQINSQAGATVADPGLLSSNKLIDVDQQSGSKVWWQTTTLNSIVPRAPAHEPWPLHEVNGIATFNVATGVATPTTITRPTTGTTTSGVAGTTKGNNINEANLSTQPTPTGTVCGLTLTQTQALFAQIGQRESGGNYKAVNSIGYVGKYQFGSQLLETQGYLKKGASKTGTNAQVISNSNNWTGINGCNSQQDWLNNPSVQEQAMQKFTQANCNSLKKKGVITSSSTPDQIGGYLMAAHLVGVGGAVKLWQYNNGQGGAVAGDAYGTTSQSYYALGSNAVQLGSSVQTANG